MRYYATGGKRFYVIDVLGYAITPRYRGGDSSSRRATRSYAVLDRDDMHREVGIFDTRSGAPEAVMKRRAYELAAKLNRAAKPSDGVRTLSHEFGVVRPKSRKAA